MRKRDFLKLSAIAILATACNSLTDNIRLEGENPTSINESPKDTILVIGAGMAGLGAARQLHDAGYTVTVLEGRDRIGGRVWSSRLWDGIPVDMGASWIHGIKGNPLTTLADEVGVARLDTDYDNMILYNTNGEVIDETVQTEMERLTTKLATAVLLEAKDDQTLREGIEATTIWSQLSVTERQQVLHIINTTIEHEFSGGIGEISAANPDDTDEFAGNDVIFPDGYGRIADFLAQGIDIQLSQIVEQISYQNNGVTVRTNRDTYMADRVLVTLPLGVLKKGAVQFEPPLPMEKQEAIATIGVGLLDKLYLRFPTSFWDERFEFINWISAEHGRWNNWLNMVAYTGQPVLLGFNAAEYAHKIDGWRGTDIVADAMSVLRTMYGENIPSPESWQISRWALDPFAYGSYSFNAVGTSVDTRRTLAKAVGDRLFFAGEATSEDHPATVHGAYVSGLCAASTIMEL